MKLFKSLFFSVLFLFLLSGASAVTIDDNAGIIGLNTSMADNAGIIDLNDSINESIIDEDVLTPSSPFYGLKRFAEQLMLFFTFNEEAKARLHLNFADERIKEAKLVVKEGNTQVVTDLLGEYDNEMNSSSSIINSLEAANYSSINTLKIHLLQQATEHIQKLQTVYSRVPDQAKSGIARAMNKAIMRYETVINKTANNNENNIRVYFENDSVKIKFNGEYIEINSEGDITDLKNKTNNENNNEINHNNETINNNSGNGHNNENEHGNSGNQKGKNKKK